LIFEDDFSYKVYVYFLRHKNEAFLMFKKFKALVKDHNRRKIKKPRTNNGLEFCELDINELCVVQALLDARL